MADTSVADTLEPASPILQPVDLWRCRQVRCHPAAQPAPVVRSGAAFLPGRCAGAPGIAMRLPRAVRAAGGSGADHRRAGRRLHAVLRHSLPAAPADHLPPFHRLESEVPPCPNNRCRRCRCGASSTSSLRPRCWRYALTVRSTACPSGHEGWWVTGYDEAKAVLSDAAFRPAGMPPAAFTPDSVILGSPGWLVSHEGGEHARLRAIAAQFAAYQNVLSPSGLGWLVVPRNARRERNAI